MKTMHMTDGEQVVIAGDHHDTVVAEAVRLGVRSPRVAVWPVGPRYRVWLSDAPLHRALLERPMDCPLRRRVGERLLAEAAAQAWCCRWYEERVETGRRLLGLPLERPTAEVGETVEYLQTPDTITPDGDLLPPERRTGVVAKQRYGCRMEMTDGTLVSAWQVQAALDTVPAGG